MQAGRRPSAYGVVPWGKSWGLFRHSWVVAKLALTTIATVILLAYMRTFAAMAAAAASAGTPDDVRNPSPVLHGVLAMFALLVTTALSVYKPRGLTPYGRRLAQGDHTAE